MERRAQQITLYGSLHVDCMRVPERWETFYFQADVGMNPDTATLKSPLAGVSETADEPETARGRIDQAKQAF